MKKFISIVMIFVLILSLSVMPVTADIVDAETIMILQGEIIPQNVAEVLADMFVQSNVNSDIEIGWKDNTGVQDSEILYDGKGLPCAYCVKMETEGKSNGYVVISAYPDMANYILEYADTEKPIYEEFDREEADRVVYTENLQYFQQTGDATVVDIRGEEVYPEDIVNVFDDIRNEAVIDQTKNLVQEVVNECMPNISLFGYQGLERNGAIEDPYYYIMHVYGDAEDMVAYEWKTMESFIRHRTMDMFNRTTTGNCGPTAITNIVEFIGNQKNIPSIKNVGIHEIIVGCSRWVWTISGMLGALLCQEPTLLK